MKMIDTYAEKQMIERTDEMQESAQAGRVCAADDNQRSKICSGRPSR